MVSGKLPPDVTPPPPSEPTAPTRPATPPLVTNADGLLTHNWEWIELGGRLIQTQWSTSPKARTFTRIELADGARVTLTYGAPPPGWEGLIDQRIRVVGFMTLCGRAEGGQSLSGPHLQMWETPQVLGEETAGPVAVDAAAVSKRISDHCLGR